MKKLIKYLFAAVLLGAAVAPLQSASASWWPFGGNDWDSPWGGGPWGGSPWGGYPGYYGYPGYGYPGYGYPGYGYGYPAYGYPGYSYPGYGYGYPGYGYGAPYGTYPYTAPPAKAVTPESRDSKQ